MAPENSRLLQSSSVFPGVDARTGTQPAWGDPVKGGSAIELLSIPEVVYANRYETAQQGDEHGNKRD